MKFNFLALAVMAGFGLLGLQMTPHMVSPAFADDVGDKKIAVDDDHPLAPYVMSGYLFRDAETQGLQDDEFENPGMLWVENGAELWSKVDGEAGQSCQSCHGDAEEFLNPLAASYPKWNDNLERPLTLEQQVNLCRTENMKAAEWKWESNEMLSLTAFAKHQALGAPVTVQVDGPMAPHFENGKELYYTRVGQLDMACATCHENHYGENIRSDHLSQGQSNGFPLYRLKWQKLGSLHRRFKGCMQNIRAVPYERGSPEFVDLEIYLAWRGMGLPVETPAVRH